MANFAQILSLIYKEQLQNNNKKQVPSKENGQRSWKDSSKKKKKTENEYIKVLTLLVNEIMWN